MVGGQEDMLVDIALDLTGADARTDPALPGGASLGNSDRHGVRRVDVSADKTTRVSRRRRPTVRSPGSESGRGHRDRGRTRLRGHQHRRGQHQVRLPASSIYWHFKDKDDLIAAVIERSLARGWPRGSCRWI
jgi:hypothetical protein